jgi:hypothetical protein
VSGIQGISRAAAVAMACAVVASCLGSAPNASQPPAVHESTALSTEDQVSSASASTRVAEADLPPWSHRTTDRAALQRAADTRVFFAHQSVGGNVLKGIVALFEDAGLPPPLLVDTEGGVVPAEGGYIAHGRVGRNGEPLDKLRDFEATLREGTLADVDVALLKFCYADVKEHTDTQALFREYQETLLLLERRLPDVVFLHTTVPLTVDEPEDNAARMTYNSRVREAYADSGRLWDLAAIESTTLDGQRVGGVVSSHAFESLHSAYSTDGGHLNDQGARLAAAALLRMVAQDAED